MNIEESAKTLLKLVENYRSQECREAIDKARAEAAEVLRRAWRRERDHLHASVEAERSRARTLIQSARAERATRERTSGDRLNADLLALAWPRLRAMLEARWRDPVGRETWVARALEQALAALPAGPWTVRHASDWAAPEAAGPCVAVAAKLAASLPAASSAGEAPALRFLADPALAAGLIVDGGGAVLDASLDGLLADRQQLDARLLALLALHSAGQASAPAARPQEDHP
jgi:vacuolar-type H+-ATPase subunit H